ncbi:hypothetical protein, partial [Prevotella intermedia]|uniref:hypothetical protein n=1 Tax=Prevotella intermedia TaxID=28131 RepID=UPI001C5DEC03
MRKAAHFCHLYIYCGSVAYCAPTFLCGRFSNAINTARNVGAQFITLLTPKKCSPYFPTYALHTNRLTEWNNVLKYYHILLL